MSRSDSAALLERSRLTRSTGYRSDRMTSYRRSVSLSKLNNLRSGCIQN
jgi:hypothetical protein